MKQIYFQYETPLPLSEKLFLGHGQKVCNENSSKMEDKDPHVIKSYQPISLEYDMELTCTRSEFNRMLKMNFPVFESRR